MSVIALSRAVLLVPELVKIMHAEIKPKVCRKRGVGELRNRLKANPDPHNEAAERILSEICRSCPLPCEMARKKDN
jgi:hypothetical protein